jgi:sugar phosphate isomerase/epimerase
VHGNIGAVFKCVGPAHIGLQLPWPADVLSLRGEQVVHAHVNDAPAGVAQDELIDTERLLPGASGVLDARAFLTVPDEIGFDGPTLVEPFNAEVRALPPEERVAASLESVWP